jgi:hypothetical protein
MEDIFEDISRVVVLPPKNPVIDVDLAIHSLRQDQVVLIQDVGAGKADNIMHDVAQKLGLLDSLQLQAGFADLRGHRYKIGKFFMSVNKRKDYQFVTPHSESTSFANLQIASFHCYENSTDGGETILMNVCDSTDIWQSFRERVNKARVGSRPLARHEIVRARALYQLDLPRDLLRDGDQILQEHHTDIPDLTVVEVLSKPRKSYSCILNEERYVYWDTIEANDFDSASEWARLLRQWGLLKEPIGGLDLRRMDADADRRIRHSGVSYTQLFKRKITLKLAPRELVLVNNLTWTHAANNWTPGSGKRRIAAAFA